MVNTLTEAQMRARMREIEFEKKQLSNEQKKYENYFLEKEQEEKMKSHEEFVGKCYKTTGVGLNKHIKAFKILEVLKPHHENYAVCVTLIDGCRVNCWHEYGVQIMTLGLWNADVNRMTISKYDPRMIDRYEEITQAEFEELYREYTGKVEDKVYM